MKRRKGETVEVFLIGTIGISDDLVAFAAGGADQIVIGLIVFNAVGKFKHGYFAFTANHDVERRGFLEGLGIPEGNMGPSDCVRVWGKLLWLSARFF
jgi:hypothetical protein